MERIERNWLLAYEEGEKQPSKQADILVLIWMIIVKLFNDLIASFQKLCNFVNAS